MAQSSALGKKDKKIIDINSMEEMKDCIEQSFSATPLTIINDL